MKKKTVNMKMQGSFTIEAAVVVPLAMLVMVTAIFLGFYVHDCATMTAVCDYAVMDTAGKAKGNEDTIISGAEKLISQRLIGSSDVKVSVSGGDTDASASASASFHLPLPMMLQLLGDDLETITAEVDVSNLDGRKILLLYKTICDGTSDILGGTLNNGN